MAGTPHVPGTVVTSADLNDRGKIYDRSTSAVDVVSSVADTSLYSKSISANHMSTDRIVRALILGDYLNDSGADRQFTLRVKLGGSTLFEDLVGQSGFGIAANAVRRPFAVQVCIANLGATNAQFAWGFVSIGMPGATTGLGDLGQMAMVTPTSHEALRVAPFAFPATIDTTAACTLDVTVQHSASSASLSLRKKYAVLELL